MLFSTYRGFPPFLSCFLIFSTYLPFRKQGNSPKGEEAKVILPKAKKFRPQINAPSSSLKHSHIDAKILYLNFHPK